jgi:hypothetical protein
MQASPLASWGAAIYENFVRVATAGACFCAWQDETVGACTAPPAFARTGGDGVLLGRDRDGPGVLVKRLSHGHADYARSRRLGNALGGGTRSRRAFNWRRSIRYATGKRKQQKQGAAGGYKTRWGFGKFICSALLIFHE